MGEIILHGDCLVNRAAELHQLLLHLLHGADDRVEIDMSATGRCDISFFQLICSACRGFSRRNKQIALRSPLPASVVNQFRKAGFHSACSVCDHTQCLFKGTIHDMQENNPL